MKTVTIVSPRNRYQGVKGVLLPGPASAQNHHNPSQAVSLEKGLRWVLLEGRQNPVPFRPEEILP